MSDTVEYGGGSVAPGETLHGRYAISETFLGESIRVPLTVINGKRDGPTVFFSAAVHGDELNDVKVVHDLVQRSTRATWRGRSSAHTS